MQKFFPLVILLLWFNGCSPTHFSEKDNLSKNAEFLEEQGKSYWEKRADPENARKARFFLSQAYSLKSTDKDLAILYSRACYFVGHYIETDPANKDSLFIEGASVAKKILYQSKIFLTAYSQAEGDSIIRALKGIETSDESTVPALYWWAANFGQYLVNKPVVDRLKYRDLMETIILRTLVLNPAYFYGGPYRLLGMFYIRIPGIELSQSKSYFDYAINTFPDYFATPVLMAQYYHTKAGNREQFHSILINVTSADPTVLPDVMAENLYEQEFARQLLEKEASLFE